MEEEEEEQEQEEEEDYPEAELWTENSSSQNFQAQLFQKIQKRDLNKVNIVKKNNFSSNESQELLVQLQRRREKIGQTALNAVQKPNLPSNTQPAPLKVKIQGDVVQKRLLPPREPRVQSMNLSQPIKQNDELQKAFKRRSLIKLTEEERKKKEDEEKAEELRKKLKALEKQIEEEKRKKEEEKRKKELQAELELEEMKRQLEAAKSGHTIAIPQVTPIKIDPKANSAITAKMALFNRNAQQSDKKTLELKQQKKEEMNRLLNDEQIRLRKMQMKLQLKKIHLKKQLEFYEDSEKLEMLRAKEKRLAELEKVLARSQGRLLGEDMVLDTSTVKWEEDFGVKWERVKFYYFEACKDDDSPTWKLDVIQTDTKECLMQIKAKPFGKGAFRFAFYSKTDSGEKLVTKSFMWKMERNVAWDECQELAKIHAIGQYFAREYENQNHLAISINVFSLYIIELLDRQNEIMTAEPIVPGKWAKFNDNDGYLDPDHLAAHKFSYFTYTFSQHNMLMVDLQGSKESDRYNLTDPALLTPDGLEFGDTNTGEKGISKFLNSYQKFNS